MGKTIKDSGQESRPQEQEGAENKAGKKGTSEISRRGFLLGTAAAIGGTALLGSSRDASAFKDLSGWPDRFGCLTDLTACVGCRSCEAACNEANNLPKPSVPFDEVSVFKEKRRPSVNAYTVVNQYKNPKDESKPLYRKVQCNHCNEPACALCMPDSCLYENP